MTKLEKSNYDYLKEVQWFNHVESMKVVMHDKETGRTTSFTCHLKEGESVAEALLREKVTKDRVDVTKEIHDGIQEYMQSYIDRELLRYDKAIAIHNMLCDLKVKDKRTYSSGETYEGKIRSGELINTLPMNDEQKISYSNDKFVVKFNCPYDYDWSNGGNKRVWDKKKCLVSYIPACDLHLTLEFTSQAVELPVGDGTKKFLKLPCYDLQYILTDTDNKPYHLCLINACNRTRKWSSKTYKKEWNYKFSSYRVNKEQREVSLNTFIIYCREKSDDNKSMFIQEMKEDVNAREMMNELRDKFGADNVSQVNMGKSDVNFNYCAYWGRYGSKCVKISLEDGSYILYDFNDLKRYRDLKLLGIYDSTYVKEKVSDAYKRVMTTNKIDSELVTDMMEVSFKKDK